MYRAVRRQPRNLPSPSPLIPTITSEHWIGQCDQSPFFGLFCLMPPCPSPVWRFIRSYCLFLLTVFRHLRIHKGVLDEGDRLSWMISCCLFVPHTQHFRPCSCSLTYTSYTYPSMHKKELILFDGIVKAYHAYEYSTGGQKSQKKKEAKNMMQNAICDMLKKRLMQCF